MLLPYVATIGATDIKGTWQRLVYAVVKSYLKTGYKTDERLLYVCIEAAHLIIESFEVFP